MNPLLLDPVRVYVGKLKSTIQSLEHKVDNFKKYDANRKVYYSKAMQRLGELESWIDETDPEFKLRGKIQSQKQTITNLSALIKASKLEVPEDFDLAKAKVKILELQKEVNALTKQNTSLKASVSELVYKLNNQS
ncbi:hypothetical protein [Intestinibacter bartlettii]|mgnify:FL=1|uniref:hypothetical protein n=1 Tax=Intestinibacter bartlettii TaxID=261299 RepID=UPI0039F46120